VLALDIGEDALKGDEFSVRFEFVVVQVVPTDAIEDRFELVVIHHLLDRRVVEIEDDVAVKARARYGFDFPSLL